MWLERVAIVSGGTLPSPVPFPSHQSSGIGLYLISGFRRCLLVFLKYLLQSRLNKK
jgi:hypothetical protein